MAVNKSAYSFKNVSVSYDGIIITGFFSGDDAIVVTPAQKKVETIIGADGGGTWNVKGDNSATVTLKLLASSPSNDTFATFYEILRLGSTVTPGLLIIKDSKGKAMITGDFIVENYPEDTHFGEKDSGRAWILHAIDPLILPGRIGEAYS